MALLSCPECSAEISDKAKACVKCGHPIKASTPAIRKGEGKLIMWCLLFLGSIFMILAAFGGLNPGSSSDSRYAEQRRAECTAAMTSNMGTSTRSYSDRMAYEAHVKEKCKGFSINGVDLGK